jgi:FixJ family two-component response regulator
MLTAHADEHLARDTLRRGAFDYVTKPFSLDHLIRVVEFALAS